MQLRLAALTSILLATTVAHAEMIDYPDPLDDPPKAEKLVVAKPAAPKRSPMRLEGGIGIRWGSFLVNNIDAKDTVKQLHLDGGFRLHQARLFLYGQYAFHSMQIPLEEIAERSGTPVAIGNGRGIMHRLGAHARYSFGRAGEHDGGIDLYADAGIGVQHIRWDAGGAWTRPDLSMSLGLAGFGIGERQHGGLSLALVFVLSPRNDIEGMGRACGGPCDYATQPTGVDRSFMFDVTMMFGK